DVHQQVRIVLLRAERIRALAADGLSRGVVAIPAVALGLDGGEAGSEAILHDNDVLYRRIARVGDRDDVVALAVGRERRRRGVAGNFEFAGGTGTGDGDGVGVAGGLQETIQLDLGTAGVGAASIDSDVDADNDGQVSSGRRTSAGDGLFVVAHAAIPIVGAAIGGTEAIRIGSQT